MSSTIFSMLVEDDVRRLLNQTRDLLADDVPGVLAQFATGLSEVRAALPRAVWKTVVRDVVRAHPLFDDIADSALARRLRVRPRGNGSDAILLDLMCAIPGAADNDAHGDAIYGFETKLPSIVSWRNASAYVRCRLVRLAAVRRDARALIVGCAHLREIDRTVLSDFGSGARFVAVDADPDAIASVRRRLIDTRIRTVCADPLAFAKSARRAGGRFDFVYRIVPDAEERSGGDLLALAPGLLRPGGMLLTALLATERADAGYLEACLDWWPPEYRWNDIVGRLVPVDDCAQWNVTLYRRSAAYFVTIVRTAGGVGGRIGRCEDGSDPH